jgi:cytochrome c
MPPFFRIAARSYRVIQSPIETLRRLGQHERVIAYVSVFLEEMKMPELRVLKFAFAGMAGIGMAATASAAPLPQPAAFKPCSVCHKVGPTDRSTLGPVLWGVGGRQAGSVAGFAYSPAMKASKISWTRANLTKFIANPAKTVPGTRMAYAGQKDAKAEAAVVDYLLSLK